MQNIKILSDKNSVHNYITEEHWIEALRKSTLDQVIRNGEHGIWSEIRILSELFYDFHLCSSLDTENNIIITGYAHSIKTNAENIKYTDTSSLLGKAYIDVELPQDQYSLCINILKQKNSSQLTIMDFFENKSLYRVTYEFIGKFKNRHSTKEYINNMIEQNKTTIENI